MVLVNDLWIQIHESRKLINEIYDLLNVDPGKANAEALLKKKDLHKPDLAHRIMRFMKQLKHGTEYLEKSVKEIEKLREETKEAKIELKTKDSVLLDFQKNLIKRLDNVTNTNSTMAHSQERETVNNQAKHKLLIEKDDGTKITDNLWSTVVKTRVQKKLQNYPVSNSYLKHDGVGAMIFPSADIRDKAADVLKSDYKVTPLTQVPKKLAPKFKVIGVPSELFGQSEDHIIQEIRAKNQHIDMLINDGDEFRVIYKKKESNLLVIKTSCKIKDAIKSKNNKIYLGLQVLNVRDYIHLVQCFHCQDFGHYSGSDFCKNKDVSGTCFYCSSRQHRSHDCKDKGNSSKHRCVNCIRANRRHTRHKATDPLCPMVINETLRTYSRTDGVDQKSKDSYIQWVEKLRLSRKQIDLNVQESPDHDHDDDSDHELEARILNAARKLDPTLTDDELLRV